MGSKLGLAETKSFHAAAGRRAGIQRAGIQRAVALSPPRPPHFASSLVSFLPFRCYKAVKESYIHWVLEHRAEPTETWENIINVSLFFFFLLFFTTLLCFPAMSLPCCAVGRCWPHFSPQNLGFSSVCCASSWLPWGQSYPSEFISFDVHLQALNEHQ